MEHHRPPPMMSNGGHSGQHHHPTSQQSSQAPPPQHLLQQHPQSQAPNDVDVINSRLGYMSMNEIANGASSLNGLTSANPNDYSPHHSHHSHHHPHHHQQQQPTTPQQRSSQPPNSMHTGQNIIYYSSVNPSQTSGTQSQYQPQATHPSQLQQQARPTLSGSGGLNPNASVFVPRNQQPFVPSVPMSYRQSNPGVHHHYQNGSSRQIPVMANQQHQQHLQLQAQQQLQQQQQHQQQQQSNLAPAGPGPQFEYDNDIEDYIALAYLKDFIYVISNKPAALNMHGLREITQLVNTYLEEDECVLELVVNQLVDVSIVDGNFRFNGVKIMIHFMDHILPTRSGTFKKFLFNRIQRECSRKVLPNSENTVTHMSGLALLIGDLFVQTDSKEIGLALPHLLMNLAGSAAKFLDDNCRCICSILKLCGKELEDLLNSEKDGFEFKTILKRLQEIVTNNEVSDMIKERIKTTLKLQENNWVANEQPSTAKWSTDVSKGPPPTLSSEYVNADDFEGGTIYYPNNPPQPQGLNYDFGNGDEFNQEICEDFEIFLKTCPPHAQQ